MKFTIWAKTKQNPKLLISIDGLWYREDKGVHSTANNKVAILGKRFVTSRIMYETFNGPIPSGIEVDHISELRFDNRLENLQLLTNRDNLLKARRFTCEEIRSFRERNLTIRELCMETGLAYTGASLILKNKTYKDCN